LGKKRDFEKSESKFALFPHSLFKQMIKRTSEACPFVDQFVFEKNCKWEKRESSAFPFQFCTRANFSFRQACRKEKRSFSLQDAHVR